MAKPADGRCSTNKISPDGAFGSRYEDLATKSYSFAPTSIRAISFKCNTVPLEFLITILPNCCSVTRRPSILIGYWNACSPLVGFLPTVPAAACTFWLLIADVTSDMVMPNFCILLGSNQMRIA